MDTPRVNVLVKIDIGRHWKVKTKISISNEFVLKHTSLSMFQCHLTAGVKKQKVESQSAFVKENIPDTMSTLLLFVLVYKLHSQTVG